MTRKSTFIFALAVLAAGCRTTSPGPLLAPLRRGPSPDEARAKAERIRDPAHAAEVLWLYGNDRAAARARLDRALARAPDEPGLRLRRALLALEALDVHGMREDLLQIIRRAPDQAEAEVALILLHEHLEALWPHRASIRGAIVEAGLLDGPAPSAGRAPLAAALLAAIARRDVEDAEAARVLARGGFLPSLRRIGPLAPPDAGGLSAAARFEVSDDWSEPGRALGRRPRLQALHAGPHPTFFGGPTPGVYVFDGLFEVSAATAERPVVLHVALPANARIHLDGELVAVRDATRRLTAARQQVELQLTAGWHRIVVSAVCRPSDRFSVAVTSREGLPVAIASKTGLVSAARTLAATDPPALAPAHVPSARGLVRRLLDDPERAAFGRLLGARLAQARWHEALDRAWWLLSGTREALPESAAFAFARARLLAQRGRAAGAQSLLQEGLQHDPRHPGALTAFARAILSERPEQALERLEAAAESAPDAWAPHATAFSAAHHLGWTAEATAALERALQRQPPDRILERGVQFFRGIEHHARADALAAELDTRDPRGAPTRRARRAERAGNTEDAIAALRLAATRAPAAPHLTRIAELELARLRTDAADRAAQEALRHEPEHPAALTVRLRAALLRGDLAAAERALDGLRRSSESTLEREALLGDLEPPAALGAALAHDRWQGVLPKTAGGLPPGRDPADRWSRHDEVVLLDRVVDQLLPDGRVLSWHHDITRLQTKEATDRAGETAVPPDALLLTMRTLKQDGREVEVDRHAGKEDLSFSALAPGDAIERRWVRIESQASSYGGYHRRFYFRATTPLVRSELVVIAPEGLTVEHEAFNGAPAPTITATAGHTLYVWRAEAVPAVTPEPLAVRADEFLPRVLVWSDLSTEDARRAQLGATREATRGAHAIDHHARVLTATIADPKDKLTRLFLWTREHVEDGPLRAPDQTLARRRGERSGLLVALARAAGVAAQLVHARDGLGAPRSAKAPDPQPFGERLVRAEPRPGQVVWAKLDEADSWLGKLPPRFEGGTLLFGGASPEVRPVPPAQVGRQLARTRVELTVEATGAARGRVVLTVPAARARGTRRFLRTARMQVLDQQLQGLVAQLVRGARLLEHDWSGGPLEDLELRFEIEAPYFMRRDQDHLVAEELFERPLVLLLTQQPLLDAYLAVPNRRTPLLVRPAEEHLEVTLRLPEGAEAPAVRPQSFSHALSAGRFGQSFEYDPAARTAHLSLRYRTDLRRVAPDAFPAFAEQAQAMLQALRNRLVVRVVPRQAALGTSCANRASQGACAPTSRHPASSR